VRIKKNLIFHMSRHTFGTLLGQNGVRIEDISRLMGHASLKETAKYVKPAEEIMRSAVSSLNATKVKYKFVKQLSTKETKEVLNAY